jgi:aspartate aminotransferase-like enzyme
MRLAIAALWSDSASRVPTSRVTAASADVAAKAVRWGVSEMGLSLTIDGRECPGCNSPQRFCHGTRTDIRLPVSVDSQQFIRQLIANVTTGESQAVGLDGLGSFYLDVGALSQLNKENVLDLLSATSKTLQRLGQPTNTRAAMTVADDILSN